MIGRLKNKTKKMKRNKIPILCAITVFFPLRDDYTEMSQPTIESFKGLHKNLYKFYLVILPLGIR